MPGRKKKAKGGPNNAYLISFGDTMTALLAFFIVLNSLASEQTGANFYSGTGSFIRATDSLGVPGIFDVGRSQYALQLQETSPKYMVSDEEESLQSGAGPDDEDDQIYVRDRELDDFERMLNELERWHRPEQKRDIQGEVTFDWHRRLPEKGPYLDKSLQRVFADIRPFVLQPNSEVEIVIWTPTPSPTAWQRSTIQANDVREEVSAYLQLTREQATRIKNSSRQWISSTMERPVMSVVIRKVAASRSPSMLRQ